MSIRKINGVVIDADTIDGLNAQNAANQVPVLDASADIPDAQIPDTITRDTELTTHAGLDTGVHGAGASTLATAANIATHAGLATVHQDAPALIATHTGIATAHQDAPGLIATHSTLATGIHGVGGSTVASVADIATHTAIATAHQDAPALIATHTGLPTVHQDAPALIATHAALATHLVSGLINMWHGTIATIPSGWVICDGNNSTPNLLTRFIEGVATAATNPGATGGATAKTTAGHIHTMPTHTHTYTPNSETTNYDAGATILPADNTQATTDPRDPGDANINTDGIADIRPLFYDIAFLMKT